MAPKIEGLAWISGDWQTAPGGRAQIEEHWILPAGGTMIGIGRTTAGNKTVEFEFLRIEQRGDDIYYVANPKRQLSTDRLQAYAPQRAGSRFRKPGTRLSQARDLSKEF
jgi:hypothetical protein